MTGPRWWRRLRQPHLCELVELEIALDGRPIVLMTLEQLALATKYGGGIGDQLDTFPGWNSDHHHVALATRYRDP